MVAPELVRGNCGGVTLLGDPNRPGGVTLAFTERTGGVSKGGYSSLNLGGASVTNDDEVNVSENLRRALAAIGAEDLVGELIRPKQVHGDRVVVIGEPGLSAEEGRRAVREGADAVVCLLPKVPVLLCFADCVPVVLVAKDAFAVVHSGWRGTMARIAGKALRALAEVAGCSVTEVLAYVGPHVRGRDYEVSEELAYRFRHEFGEEVVVGERNLDLLAAIRKTLALEGLPLQRVVAVEESTITCTDRFFSYRVSGGACGRHGALACLGTAWPRAMEWQQ